MSIYWIGCDPGTPLTMAFLSGEGKLIGHATDANILTDGANDVKKVSAIMKSWSGYMKGKGHTVKVAIEKVGIRPGESLVHAVPFVGSMFMAEAIAATLGLETHLVTPQRWKRDMKLTSNKQQSVVTARALFPEKATFFRRIKDHNIAEAALLALYAKRNL